MLHPTDENRTLWDATLDDGKLHGWSIPQDSSAVPLRDERHSTATDSVGVSPLGSGSDYTVFLQRIGVCGPPLNLERPLIICRFRVGTKVLARRFTIPCITIILFSTLNDGKKSTEMRAFSAT